MSFLDDEDTFSSDEAPSELPDRDVLSLMVLSGPQAGHWFRVPKEGGVIGRGSKAQIRIEDPYLSREHAKIDHNGPGSYILRDLGSRYGVYIEGQRIEFRALEDGHRVQLSGDTVVRVRLADPTEDELMHQLQRAAMFDSLTDLANRRYLMQRLDQEISFSRRHKSELAIMLIDVDNFKEVNDTYGHEGGDRALRAVARLLERGKRREDVVARYAGDEFVIVCRGDEPGSVLEFANRLCRGIRNHPINLGKRRVSLTFSIGVAGFNVTDANDSPMALFVRADSALYRSKLEGRNRATAWLEPTDRKTPGKPTDDLDTLRVAYPPDRPTDPPAD